MAVSASGVHVAFRRGVFSWNSVARTILQAQTNSACCTNDITNSLADNILAGELAGLDVKDDIYPDT